MDLENENLNHKEEIINLERNIGDMMHPQNLLEEQIFEEFYKRITEYRNGKLDINKIISEFNLL
jgi:DNA mismatch repair ATPase MutS